MFAVSHIRCLVNFVYHDAYNTGEHDIHETFISLDVKKYPILRTGHVVGNLRFFFKITMVTQKLTNIATKVYSLHRRLSSSRDYKAYYTRKLLSSKSLDYKFRKLSIQKKGIKANLI